MAIAATGDGRIGRYPILNLSLLLGEPKRSTEDLQLLSELATAQQIELGDLSGLTFEQFVERWDQLRNRRRANSGGQ